MTKRKKRTSTISAIFGLVACIVFVIPYIVLSFANIWQVRWFFGLILYTVLPVMLLFFAWNPKIRMTTFDPKELRENQRFLRYIGPLGRIFLTLISITVLYWYSYSYVRSSYRLISNGWQIEHVTGIVTQSRSSGKAGFITRSICLDGTNVNYELLYPLGKKCNRDLRYELLILPGTRTAVDWNRISDVQERPMKPSG